MGNYQRIDQELFEQVSQKAVASPRKRMNHNFHSSHDAVVNRLINALEPETYCRPHKHEFPEKDEIFLVLKGRVGVLLFDDAGKVIDTIEIDPGLGVHGVDIPPKTWHTIVCLERGSISYEVKPGPYQAPIAQDFASWAPEEGSTEATPYLEWMRGQFE